jgi:hypothetical protein
MDLTKKKTIDFVEILALVIKLMTIRTIVSLVAYKGWKMHHLDMISKNIICIYLAQWQNLNPIIQTPRPHHHNGYRVCPFFFFFFSNFLDFFPLVGPFAKMHKSCSEMIPIFFQSIKKRKLIVHENYTFHNL